MKVLINQSVPSQIIQDPLGILTKVNNTLKLKKINPSNNELINETRQLLRSLKPNRIG